MGAEEGFREVGERGEAGVPGKGWEDAWGSRAIYPVRHKYRVIF